MSGKIRIRFSKTGRAKYISHLDLMATMRRAMIRAGLELAYSEGFNPHPYMSIALPLSVGSSSVCELMDVGITYDISPDGLSRRINKVLPEGLKILDVYPPEWKFNYISWVEIRGLLYYDTGAPSGVVERLTERFAEERIVISKKTKSGISDIDISKYFRDINFQQSGEVIMSARISAQNPSINPENLMGALYGEYKTLMPDFHDFTRIEIFDKNMNLFK